MLAWMRDLETATTVSDVLYSARRCVDGLPPSTVLQLPESCRMHPLQVADDVRWWSERLSEEYWRRRGLGLDAGPLQDAWSFFLRASIRTSQLATRTIEA